MIAMLPDELQTEIAEVADQVAATMAGMSAGDRLTSEAGIDRLLHRGWLLDNLSGTPAAQFERVLQQAL